MKHINSEKFKPIDTIEIYSYNLEAIKISVIMKLKEDYPGLSNNECAMLLGLSDRTLYRYFEKHDFKDKLYLVKFYVEQKAKMLQLLSIFFTQKTK
jgi:predicted DNA-binding protein (UPF0251 family)